MADLQALAHGTFCFFEAVSLRLANQLSSVAAQALGATLPVILKRDKNTQKLTPNTPKLSKNNKNNGNTVEKAVKTK